MQSINNFSMNNSLKIKYENAAKTPDEAIFTIKDVLAILKLSSHPSVQRIDRAGLIKVKRNSQNFRIYSYNDIQLIVKIHKLIKLSVPLTTLKTLMEFETSKGRDPNVFIEEFLEFYTKRVYSRNRNEKRKAQNKQN